MFTSINACVNMILMNGKRALYLSSFISLQSSCNVLAFSDDISHRIPSIFLYWRLLYEDRRCVYI